MAEDPFAGPLWLLAPFLKSRKGVFLCAICGQLRGDKHGRN